MSCSWSFCAIRPRTVLQLAANRNSAPKQRRGSQAGQALAQRPSLAFADRNFSGSGVGHDEQKAAFEVGLNLFYASHIYQHFAARAKEKLRGQRSFEFGKLVVYRERIGGYGSFSRSNTSRDSS